MKRFTVLRGLLAGAVLLVVFVASAAARVSDRTATGRQLSRAAAQPAVEEGPGVLMGAPQKEHWESGSAECKTGFEECSDEISQGQFVAWPFVAEHSGTVEAIFAVLDGSNYGTNTGSELGIYANRTYHYAEITYNNAFENSKGGCSCTWTAADFMKYESEIPPEVPGALLGTSGKVAESKIKTEKFTEFKLEHPVKVVKGVKYWLANTTFQNYPLKAGEQGHVYQKFVHERESSTEGHPWGVYSNEPSNWEEVARPLKELPTPETSKINCEECNTEGWLQEEPKGKHLTNVNREAQEEGGQTFSYAFGKIEEGAPGEESPTATTGTAADVTETTAQLRGTVNPNGAQVSSCRLEYGKTGTYGSSASCSPSPGSGTSPVPVSAEVLGLEANTEYHFRISATSAHGTGYGSDQTFHTESAPAIKRLSVRKGPAAGGTSITITGTGFTGVTGVSFGSTAASEFEVQSPTSITAVSPPGTTGTVEIKLTTPSGQSVASARARFIYERPTVTSVSPGNGPLAGGTAVTVIGSGFGLGSQATQFQFGTAPAVSVDCTSTSECTMDTPAGRRAGTVYVLARSLRKSKKAPAASFTYE